jgi:hypothetical protein
MSRILRLPLRLALLLLGVSAGGCSYVAIHTAPQLQATQQRSSAAVGADALFWKVLHEADYAHIQTALEPLTAAYLADPADAVTAAHIGWLHIWRVAERSRLGAPPASITDDIVLAQHYFQQAVALNPHEARYLGFLASATLAAGSIAHDEAQSRRGYFEMLDAIKAWPEFNLFTAGYVLSQQPPGSARFQQAMEYQWRNLDVCIGHRIDRGNPDYARYMSLYAVSGAKRVCWNSWIAPHNFEGFFLNMGDMLVASGDWQHARSIYANARLSSTYAQWQYRDVLEQRIVNAQANVERFRAPPPTPGRTAPGPRMMFAEDFACMACHQQ